VALALYPYLAGLPFAAIDWPLNYAFYARQNTLVPAAVGVVSVGAWFAAALTLPHWVAEVAGARHGYLGLVAADTAKHAVHALIMLALVARVTKGAGLARVLPAALKAALAALGMGIVVAAVDDWLAVRVGGGTLAWAVRCAFGVGVGVLVYGLLASVLRLGDLGWLVRQVRARGARSL
jgi:putative peptidoglycan lipid II flippase